MTTPAGHAMEISVAIVTYQSGATLARCLEALKGQSVQPLEVILADNASDDGAPQAAAAADPSLRLLAMGANLGFAAANNRAAEAAHGRWLVLLNPDAYARPDWLERLLACAEAYPRGRCFTSRQLMAGAPDILDGVGDAMTGFGFPFRGGYGAPDPGPLGCGEVFSACGAAMMIDRSLFLDLGGFDESFFCYGEDVDLGYRLRLIGEPVILADDAIVLHEGSVSTGGRRSEFSMFHGARNRLWVFIKNTPPLLFWLTAPLHGAATLGRWAAGKALGQGGALGRGLRAGVAGLPQVLAARRRVQATRTVSSLAVARMMVWSPWQAWRRQGKLKR